MSFGDEEPTELLASFSGEDIAVLKQYCEHAAR
jgi:hypothetical protein